MHIADNGRVAFTRSGTAITFNVAPPPIDSVPADSLVGKAVFDLWHYKDPVLQPTQRSTRRATATSPTRRSTSRRRRSSCSSPTIRSRPSACREDGKIGVANSRERYMIEQMWGDGGTDVYVDRPGDERAAS